MITTPKSTLIVITFGFILYCFFYFLGVSIAQYHSITIPPRVEHVTRDKTHPLQTVFQLNQTEDAVRAFHLSYYDPYDLYI